ncbi:MAG: hypothetical protein WDW38_011115 [Sanguina aurantia]
MSPAELSALPVIVPTPISSPSSSFSIVIVLVKAPLHTTSSWLPSGRASPAHLEANSFLRPSADRSQARCIPQPHPSPDPCNGPHAPPPNPPTPAPVFPFTFLKWCTPVPSILKSDPSSQTPSSPLPHHAHCHLPSLRPPFPRSLCPASPWTQLSHHRHPSTTPSLEHTPSVPHPATVFPCNGNNNDVSPVLPTNEELVHTTSRQSRDSGAAAAAAAAAAAWATPSGVFDPVFTSDSNRPISTPLPPTHASPCNKLAAGLSARELGRRALPLTPDEQTEVETTSAALHCADRPAELPSESTADVGTAYTPAMSTPAPAFAFSSFFAGARLPPVRALMTAEEVTAAEEAAAAVLVSSAYCAVKGMLADQVLTAGGAELCAAHTLEAQDSMTQPLSEADMLAFWAGEEVGKGAGGCVYSIEWEEAPAGRAALKMCIVGPDPETIAAALREACLLAHLHAAAGGGGGAVRVFRVGISRGEEQGTLLVWTVMTQCQGELSHLFQAQRDKTYRMNAQFTADNAARFPPALVRSHTTAMQLRNALPLVRSMRDAAAAVSLCQQIGVVHGDIKFNNAMFSSGRNSPLVLIDFGTAKLLHGAPTAPMEGMATLPFMAPECFRNRSANCSCPIVSFATDVFAIGTMSAALAGDIARVLAVRFPDAPAFLLRMIHTNPDQRPTAAEVALVYNNWVSLLEDDAPRTKRDRIQRVDTINTLLQDPQHPSRAVMRQLADISAYLELRLCLSDDMSHDMQWLGKFDMRAAWLTSDAVGCVGQLGSYMIGIALMVWVGEPDELLAGMEERWQAMGQNMERVRTVLAAEGITCSLVQASVEHAARFESVYAS